MSIAGLLLRFAALYIGLTVAVAVGFNLLGAKMNSGVGIGALIGSVLGASLWFTNKNKRAMEPREKRAAFLGMWAIDMCIQVAVTLLAASATVGVPSLGPLLGVVAFVGALHGLGIYLMVGMAARMYAKQAARSA